MPAYQLDHIRFSYGPQTVLDDLSQSFEAGHFYAVIGPNGSGKTTLIDLLAGHRKPDEGTVRLHGRRLDGYGRKAMARTVALVPQDFHINFPYTCGEVVMMGRYPHIPRFSSPGEEDRRLVRAVMEKTALTDFRERFVNRLSGGERQRVVFARSLAQDTPVLLLDEATSNLDMHHALALLDLAAGRVAAGALVIAVMQDVNLAAMYCDRMVCMRRGGIYASGPVAEVLNAEMLEAVFRVEAQVFANPFSGAHQVAFRKGADGCQGVV